MIRADQCHQYNVENLIVQVPKVRNKSLRLELTNSWYLFFSIKVLRRYFNWNIASEVLLRSIITLGL